MATMAITGVIAPVPLNLFAISYLLLRGAAPIHRPDCTGFSTAPVPIGRDHLRSFLSEEECYSPPDA